MTQTPKGFWSYARFDDEHLDGALTELRKRVASEVSLLLGCDVSIFQDTEGLRTGDRWAKKLREGVTSATFLIPVLTPLYFNRPWCREETLTFLRVAREQGIEPHIFPILFVELDDQDGDELRVALADFQYKDFCNWRFESDPTRQLRTLNEFAKDVKARLKAAAGPAKLRAPAQPVSARPQVSAGTSERTEAAAAPRPVPEPPPFATFTVDPLHRGDFTSIAAAIEAAPAGSRIVVRPGTYREALRLSKPLELTGEGDRERIVVTTAEGAALHCDAPMARVSGMTFRREAGGEHIGVWITGGAVELEDCAIESRSLSCVAIQGAGTAPTLRRCVMRDGVHSGILVYQGARPLVEDCELVANAIAGVEVKGEGTHATLRRCVARDGRSSGLYFHDGGGGLLERCEAVANANVGIAIKTGADPLLRHCALRDNRNSGARVYEGGRGRLEGCTIERNRGAGVLVGGGGDPVMTACTVSSNGYEAVWIKDAESGGTFEDNDLRDNARGAWDVAEGVGDRLVRQRNRETPAEAAN